MHGYVYTCMNKYMYKYDVYMNVHMYDTNNMYMHVYVYTHMNMYMYKYDVHMNVYVYE